MHQSNPLPSESTGPGNHSGPTPVASSNVTPPRSDALDAELAALEAMLPPEPVVDTETAKPPEGVQ